MGVLQVGPGHAWVKDSAGNRTVFGMLKKGTVEISLSQKFASGQYQMDMFSANTGLEVKGSFEFEELDMAMLKTLGLSQYGAAGTSLIAVVDDVKTIAVSVALTGSTDVLQVVNTTTGKFMVKVASAPVAGVSYTYSAASLGFAAGDSGTVRVTYLKAASTEQNSLTLTNALVQQSVYFGVDCLGMFDGKSVVAQFGRCVAPKLPLFGSGDDFDKRKVEVKMLADPATLAIGKISLTEVLS